MDNRRKHTRFRTAVAAEIEIEGEVFAGTTRDISQGGVSVASDAPLIEGQSIMLTLILTEDGIESAHAEALCTRARVVWLATQDDGETLAGLRFDALGNSGTRTLAALLAGLAISQPPL
jgi:c-di-GMP-binding flagellar brake protein YcgR